MIFSFFFADEVCGGFDLRAVPTSDVRANYRCAAPLQRPPAILPHRRAAVRLMFETALAGTIAAHAAMANTNRHTDTILNKNIG